MSWAPKGWGVSRGQHKTPKGAGKGHDDPARATQVQQPPRALLSQPTAPESPQNRACAWQLLVLRLGRQLKSDRQVLGEGVEPRINSIDNDRKNPSSLMGSTLALPSSLG